MNWRLVSPPRSWSESFQDQTISLKATISGIAFLSAAQSGGQLINRLKQFHRLATRYDERAGGFAAMLTIAMRLHSHPSLHPQA